MPRFVAFLRAINVGGRHVVPMERLRALFEEIGFGGVETFIASGNVIFESRARDVETLATKIERKLAGELGHEVATCLRTDEEVARVARAKPFSDAKLAAATAFNIAFLRRSAPAGASRALDALRSEHDELVVDGGEVYWISKVKQSESKFSISRFERLMGVPATWRGRKTVERLAAKYPPAAPAARARAARAGA